MTTTHVYQIHIRATPEQVWQAITDPEWTRRYFHRTAFTSTLEPGSPVRYVMDDRDAVEGVIEVCEPPHRLVTTWRVLYDAAMAEEPPGRVEWTITAVGDNLTRVRLQHGDLARSPLTWANVKDGWVWVLDGMKTLIETGEPLPSPTTDPDAVPVDANADWHRAQAIECNNGCWTLLEQPADERNDEELLRRAYAAAYHWQHAARRTPANEARARWMLAKVHLATGDARRSLDYADGCLAACNEHGLVDFDLAYAHEARARALATLDDAEGSAAAWTAARAVPIADPEDRAQVEADFALP